MIDKSDKHFGRIIEIIQLFRPHQNKWIVTTLVLSGIAMIAKPWWEPLIRAIIGKKELVLPDTSVAGWLMLSLGIGLHLLNRYQEKEERNNSLHGIESAKKSSFINTLTPLAESFGEKIALFRKEEQISEAELANLLDENLLPSEIIKWEEGVEFPFDYLPQLLDILGIIETDFDTFSREHVVESDLKLLKKKSTEKKSLHQNIALLRRTLLLGSEDRTEPIYIIAPYSSLNSQFRDRTSSNYVFLDNLGDRDSLLELTITLARLYPLAPINFYHSKDFPTQLLENDLILIGGIGFSDKPNNHVALSLIKDREIPLSYDGDTLIFDGKNWSSKYEDGILTFDVGLFANVKNPWNKNKRAISIQGVHTSGVLGSVRAFSLNAAAVENHKLVQKSVGSKEYCVIFNIRLFGSRPVITNFKEEDIFEIQ